MHRLHQHYHLTFKHLHSMLKVRQHYKMMLLYRSDLQSRSCHLMQLVVTLLHYPVLQRSHELLLGMVQMQLHIAGMTGQQPTINARLLHLCLCFHIALKTSLRRAR